MTLVHLSNAQKASLRSLRHVAALAMDDRGKRLVRVGEPVALHQGEYSSVLVKVESWDPTIKDGDGFQRSDRTFLIEAGGCVTECLL